MENEASLTRDQLLSCVEFGKALTAELDPEALLERILEKVSQLFPSETWSLLLLDEATGHLKFELSIDLDLEKVKDVRLALGQGVAGRCAQTQELMIIEDVRHCEFFSGQVDEMSGSRTESLVCVPIVLPAARWVCWKW